MATPGDTRRTDLSPQRYVLVVDDVTFLRRDLATLVRSLGYDCLDVSSGIRAVELIRRRTPSLVLADYLMPQITGFDVCQWMRANKPLRDIPVVICAAHPDPRLEEWAESTGANGILYKPATRAAVRAVVESHLRRPAPAREA